ncbi:MAG: response regulator transcription factor [Clostridia bacterium]|nr:response regulator transcription factor [Clostridia bacterium]
MKIALCDDEAKIMHEVSTYINQYGETKADLGFEVFCYDSAKALEFALEETAFDIFVLDVYIGDEMGTELAGKIRKRGIESPIIFLTTSVEHAPQSFETGTLRYLIKPLNPAKFYEAMDAALAQAEKLGERMIKLKTENGIERVNAGHVLYSEAHGHYQHITLSDGEEIKVRLTVTELFNILSCHGGFLRVGGSYIINLRHVKNLTRMEVCLYNNVKIQVPRGKYNEIKNAFWDFQYHEQED